jgi:hypothetical protein
MTEKTWHSVLIFNPWLEEAGNEILQYPSSLDKQKTNFVFISSNLN